MKTLSLKKQPATNIITWCEDNGNPIPEWEERAGSVVVTFFPLSEAGTPQVTPYVKELLLLCKQPVGRNDLQKKLYLKDREHFRKTYLLPALNAGLIERTIPDKPKSRLQKYILTNKGRKWLEEN